MNSDSSHDFDDNTTIAPVPRSEIEPVSSGFSLAVETGVDRGLRHIIAPDQVTRILVGKSPACHFRLTDTTVSRRHVAFEMSGARLRMTDQGSTNGTYLQGVAVMDAFLVGGELLTLGETKIRVERTKTVGPVETSRADRFGRILGQSPEMRALYPLCERLAASTVPVLVEGETGTGKEVLAESLHEMGPRRTGPFVVFDCTSVPPNLLESALFGHEKGSFTGATATRHGVFEEANGGTLLIDEIGDLDLHLQSKLLRALERSEVQRIGANRWIRVDVRILSATRRDLDREIQEGRFRDDLFYRFAVARIELPPLRRRTGDAVVLAKHFYRQLAGKDAVFPEDFAERIARHDWPGNVRELYHAVARRIALGDDAPIRASRVSTERTVSAHAAADDTEGDIVAKILALDLPITQARKCVVDEFERRYVTRVLARHGGNVGAAAAASGIARRHFQHLKNRPPRG